MPGPLKGITVIEMAGIGPAPFACMMLADMGARVLRIDRKPAQTGGALEAMMRNQGVVDRGRESLAVDVKRPEGVELILKLVEKADVLVDGYRPGVMEKLGLGPQVCLARNPKLIFGRMTGWGQDGPLAQAAGHDLNYIALSGALHAMGAADRPPAPPLNLVGDYGGGGMLLALGVAAALVEAARSGQGQVIDAAMVDGAAVLMALFYDLQARGLWQNQRSANPLDGGAPFYGAYACRDGKFVAIGPLEPPFYRTLLQKCGLPEDEVAADVAAQWDAQAWPALKAKLTALFLTRTRQEWCDLLEGSDACFAPVLDMQEAPQHPHNAARKTFVKANGVIQPAPAPRFTRTVSQLPPAAPAPGQHTRALLGELGLADAAIEELLAAGVVFAAAPARASSSS